MPASIIDNQDLAKRVDRLAKAQTLEVSRSTMIEQVMDEVCTAFEASGDPKVWRISAGAKSTD